MRHVEEPEPVNVFFECNTWCDIWISRPNSCFQRQNRPVYRKMKRISLDITLDGPLRNFKSAIVSGDPTSRGSVRIKHRQCLQQGPFFFVAFREETPISENCSHGWSQLCPGWFPSWNVARCNITYTMSKRPLYWEQLRDVEIFGGYYWNETE